MNKIALIDADSIVYRVCCAVEDKTVWNELEVLTGAEEELDIEYSIDLDVMYTTIDGLIENVKDEDLDDAKELIKKYNDKLRKYRTCGLQKGGEYSDENLVFKVLRRNGYLDKLKELKSKLTDKQLSLKESR